MADYQTFGNRTPRPTSIAWADALAQEIANRITADESLQAQIDSGGGGGGGGANLSLSRTSTTVTISSDSGTDATITVADASNAGIISSADKVKLDAITGSNTGDQDLSGLCVKTANLSDLSSASTARSNLGLAIGTDVQAYDSQLSDLAGLSYASNSLKVVRVNAGETAFELASVSLGSGANLSSSVNSTTVTISSDSGTDATISAATSSDAGAMTAADKTKLDGIQTGATANSSDATLLSRANHTGAQAISTVTSLQDALDEKVVFKGHPSEAIDLRIRGLVASNTTKLVYSTQDHATPNYVRNTSLWSEGLDLTCVSPWNSGNAHLWAGTAITPRHIAMANHAFVVNGATIRFITADNTVITRTVSNSMQVGSTDIRIGLLDSDLPASIKPAKLLPDDYADWLTVEGTAIAKFDQEEKLCVGQLVSDIGNSWSFGDAPTDTQRLAFWELSISGDSGNPVFIFPNGETVLLTTLFTAGAGPHYSGANRAGILSAISTLGAFGHAPVDFQLETSVHDWVGIPGRPAVSSGGNGPADAGSLVQFDPSGNIVGYNLTSMIGIEAGGGGGDGYLALHDATYTHTGSFELPALTGNRVWTPPDASGTLALTASPSFSGTPTAPTAATSTNTTQIATTAFVLNEVANAVAGLLDFKGSLDASANPNYPVGLKGDTYYVNVAGKVGGASGKSVDIGDAVVCSVDNAGGTEASVGTSWFVLERNLSGVVLEADVTVSGEADKVVRMNGNNIALLLGGFHSGTANVQNGYVVLYGDSVAGSTSILSTQATAAREWDHPDESGTYASREWVEQWAGLAIGTEIQPYDAELTAIAGLTSAANKGIQFTGAGTAATFDLTAAGKALLDDADASAQRTTLGLAIGTDVQAYDAQLSSLAGLTYTSNSLKVVRVNVGETGFELAAISVGGGDALTSGTLDQFTDVTQTGGATLAISASTTLNGGTHSGNNSGDQDLSGLVVKSANLSDLANAGTARTNLGLVIGTDVQAYSSTLAAVTAGTYTGSTSITSLGTITTGTWGATTIAADRGGTGRTSHTAYALLCGGTTSTGAQQSMASVGTAGQIVKSAGAGAVPVMADDIGTITAVFDGGGSAVAAGTKIYLQVPYGGTIVASTALADVSGSAVVDVWKDTYENYPPTVADTIAASAKPTISAATKATDSTLTGWTTAITAGDVLGFCVDSCSTITRLVIQLKLRKS